MPTLRQEALRQRSGAAAASGVGIARDRGARYRIPTASAGLSGMRGNDLRGTALGRASGTDRAASDGLYRAVDGVLSPKQAAHGRVPPRALGPALLSGVDRED